jgi:hypothetical protein
MNATARLRSYGWFIVVGAALGISWWSLATMAEAFGMPMLLAAVVSAVFDGGALVVGELAMRYARSADSGAAPRAVMLLLVGTSTWLNWSHAGLLGYGDAARLMFGAPSAVAGVLVEIELRWHHRDALRQRGHVAPALPPFGRWCWLLHPLATSRRVWLITASRVRSVPVTALDMPTMLTCSPALEPSADAPEAEEKGTHQVHPTRTRTAADQRPRRPARVAPDSAWLPIARSAVNADGELPSARELSSLLRIGQDRARRLTSILAAEQLGGTTLHANGHTVTAR